MHGLREACETLDHVRKELLDSLACALVDTLSFIDTVLNVPSADRFVVCLLLRIINPFRLVSFNLPSSSVISLHYYYDRDMLVLWTDG